jgi:hypothetical protein
MGPPSLQRMVGGVGASELRRWGLGVPRVFGAAFAATFPCGFVGASEAARVIGSTFPVRLCGRVRGGPCDRVDFSRAAFVAAYLRNNALIPSFCFPVC